MSLTSIQRKSFRTENSIFNVHSKGFNVMLGAFDSFIVINEDIRGLTLQIARFATQNPSVSKQELNAHRAPPRKFGYTCTSLAVSHDHGEEQA